METYQIWLIAYGIVGIAYAYYDLFFTETGDITVSQLLFYTIAGLLVGPIVMFVVVITNIRDRVKWVGNIVLYRRKKVDTKVNLE